MSELRRTQVGEQYRQMNEKERFEAVEKATVNIINNYNHQAEYHPIVGSKIDLGISERNPPGPQ